MFNDFSPQSLFLKMLKGSFWVDLAGSDYCLGLTFKPSILIQGFLISHVSKLLDVYSSISGPFLFKLLRIFQCSSFCLIYCNI